MKQGFRFVNLFGGFCNKLFHIFHCCGNPPLKPVGLFIMPVFKNLDFVRTSYWSNYESFGFYFYGALFGGIVSCLMLWQVIRLFLYIV